MSSRISAGHAGRARHAGSVGHAGPAGHAGRARHVGSVGHAGPVCLAGPAGHAGLAGFSARVRGDARRALLCGAGALARDTRGQAVVEAAFIIPVLFLGVLLLVQPCILLYDRIVMNDAAAEGCRLLATSGSGGAQSCEAFVRRRLGAIPQQDNFHVHSGGCSYDITCSGAGASTTRVSIANEVKPLPLIAIGADALGATNASGNFVVKVEVALAEQPAWTANSPAGGSAASWVGAWLS